MRSAGKAVPFCLGRLARRPLVLGLAGALLLAGQITYLLSVPRPTRADRSPGGRPLASESFGLTPEQAARARTLLAGNGCLVCHRLGDAGGSAGPDLTNYAEREIRADDLMVFLRQPTRWYPSTTMPAYPDLSDEELRLLANYLSGLMDPARLRGLPPGSDLSDGVCGPRFVPLSGK